VFNCWYVNRQGKIFSARALNEYSKETDLSHDLDKYSKKVESALPLNEYDKKAGCLMYSCATGYRNGFSPTHHMRHTLFLKQVSSDSWNCI